MKAHPVTGQRESWTARIERALKESKMEAYRRTYEALLMRGVGAASAVLLTAQLHVMTPETTVEFAKSVGAMKSDAPR